MSGKSLKSLSPATIPGALLEGLMMPEFLRGPMATPFADTDGSDIEPFGAETEALDDAKHSCIGSLGVLPQELLLEVLGLLDVQSLCQLMQVSRKGKVIVQGLTTLRILVEFAPWALAAMAEVDVLRCHSLGLLAQVLHTSKCDHCDGSANRIGLLHCIRVCEEHKNLYNKFVPVAPAMTALGLTPKQMRSVPKMTIRTTYHHECRVLVAEAVDVERCYAKFHGELVDEKIIDNLMSALLIDHPSTWLQKNLLQPVSAGSTGHFLSEQFQRGWGTVLFPFMANGKATMGQGCRACRWVFNTRHNEKISEIDGGSESEAASESDGTSEYDHDLEMRFLSEDDMVAHIMECEHATAFITHCVENYVDRPKLGM